MIKLYHILALHRKSLADYGGGDGVRDQGGLDSALGRPYSTFDRQDLYLTPIEKAAAIGESIILNHPFVDANKRTGFLAMYALLFQNGLELMAENDDAYRFVVAIASGEKSFDEIVEWLKANTRPL